MTSLKGTNGAEHALSLQDPSGKPWGPLQKHQTRQDGDSRASDLRQALGPPSGVASTRHSAQGSSSHRLLALSPFPVVLPPPMTAPAPLKGKVLLGGSLQKQAPVSPKEPEFTKKRTP